jgi:hypothetical protein
MTVNDDGVNPNQSAEDQELVRVVMNKFTKFKKARAGYDKNWMHYYRMWRGDQWNGVKMPSHRQREVVNLIWSTIQSSQSEQVDVRPRIAYVPKNPQDEPMAQVLNDLVNADWERNNWLVPLTELILDAYVYGTGYGELGYDPDVDYGMGSTTFESGDPFYIYPDPNSNQINDRRSETFIKAEPVDTELVKREYPDKAELIKADIKDVLQSSKASINEYSYKTTNSDRDMPDTSMFTGTEQNQPNKTLVITCYLKPHDTEDYEEEDDEGRITTLVKKVYPFGRVVKIASGVVLEDTPKLPFANGLFPFVKYVNYVLPREFFGASEVEQLESPQRTFNKLINASLEILNLCGNPVWIVGTDSGIDTDSLVNRTGLVVEKEPGSEVSREAGVQLSGTALAFIDKFEGWFNEVSGRHEVSQGEAPGSVTAARAIEALQEAARTRVKQKQRNLDATIRDWGQQYADIVLEKYSKARVIRVTDDQDGTKFFRFSTEKVMGEDGREVTKASVRDFIRNPDGVLVLDGEVKEMLIADRFDVNVATISGLPFAQAQKKEQVVQLFQLGIIDEREVLEQIEYPNIEQAMARLEERKAAQAQAEAEQGGGA